jgi:hypothetical protein
MESGNFRKNSSQFDCKKSIQEIINVQQYKAQDKKIKMFLHARTYSDGKMLPQSDDFKIVSDSQRL